MLNLSVYSPKNVIAVKKKLPFYSLHWHVSISKFSLRSNQDRFFSFSQLTVQGLKYLHSQGIAHRDLKPANVLVGNSHYSSLATEDMGTIFQDRPIICKLTDFGESCSQTHMSMLSLRTSRVDRGTVTYMSPEILLPERTSGPLSMVDLMHADVWALGMVFFNLANLSQRYPYLAEVQRLK